MQRVEWWVPETGGRGNGEMIVKGYEALLGEISLIFKNINRTAW